jgi:hypothetical protein
MKKPPLPFGLASLTRSNSATVNKSALNDLLNPSHTYNLNTGKASRGSTSGGGGGGGQHHHRTSSTTLSQAIEIPDASTPYYHRHSRTPSSTSNSMLYGTMSAASGPVVPISTTAVAGSSGRKLSESVRLKSANAASQHSSAAAFFLPRKDSSSLQVKCGGVSGNTMLAGGHHNYTEVDFSNLKLKSRLDRQLSVNSALLKSSYLAAVQNNNNTSSSANYGFITAHCNKASTLNYNSRVSDMSAAAGGVETAAAINNCSSSNNNNNSLQAPGSQSLPRKKKKFASTLSSSASFLQRKRHSIESLIGFCKLQKFFFLFPSLCKTLNSKVNPSSFIKK